ncbi:hypothetical protein INR49_001243 [Caranx melampygus]|nr:hypothetical protein INR49_001243 [Caranx melampygus]
MLLDSLKLERTHIYSMLHGQQAGLQKLRQDSLFHVCQLTGDLKQNDEEKAIYGLHYNDECMYDLKKAKRQTSIGFKLLKSLETSQNNTQQVSLRAGSTTGPILTAAGRLC